MVVEAKEADLDVGSGQCIAEMVAAQTFDKFKGRNTPVIYGCVTSNTLWRFLKLEGCQVMIDLTEYFLVTPVQKVLDILKVMVA
jgi:hypothetical protein